jgi:anti-sigma B factor antagonist
MSITEQPSFDLAITDDKACKIFHMKGRLMDQQQADRLMQALNEVLEAGGHNIVLDLSGLHYMNSSGLNILINVLTRARNAGGDAVIAGVSPSVRQLFVVTKLDSVFTLTGDVPEAVTRFRA